jgi:uncharacterized membrane protein YhaH (DUF805 family)
MLIFFFNPLGRLRQYEFTLGWVFWGTLELGCLCGLMAATPNTPGSFYWFIIWMAASGLSAVSVFLLGMKRLRDAGLPVWLAVILLVPFVSVVASVVMSNMPSRSDNSGH